MATKSFLLSTFSNEIVNKFKIGYHLDIFQNNEDLLKKIHFYIQNETIRNKIAKESYEFVIKKYNWNSVLKKLLIND